MRRSVEEVDGTHDAVVGLDEEVAVEAVELLEARGQALADLALELVGALGVDSFVTSHDGMHVLSNLCDPKTESSDELSVGHSGQMRQSERSLGASTASALGLLRSTSVAPS